ncbi:uncharacterized protein LOC128735877 [Sabethes cyaneus]|uniref:uncharacterized protein LOC128735877 n=1 Tax=Sabethes cyaneus TaxID=53552 RepID=UPI00237EC4D4|nr:uncharacterized protein LOC128735877 [Sabethes cyaneus]
MAKKHCGECKHEINDLEPIFCGFCETYFHISQNCCGINTRGWMECLLQGKLLFVCAACRANLNGRSVRSYIDATLHSHEKQLPDLACLPSQVQQLSDVVAALSKKIDDFSARPKRVSNTPLSCDTPIEPAIRVKRRRVDRMPNIREKVNCGTKPIDLSDLSVPSIAPPARPKKFWLYLSGLNPSLTDSDVQKIVLRCLNISDPVDAIRLVPKGKDTSNMTFVSFKVGLDPDTKTIALDPSTWPTGLLFREFIDVPKNPSRHTLKPAAPRRMSLSSDASTPR